MSERILLEINTDHIHLILDDPGGFVAAIRDYGASGARSAPDHFSTQYGVRRVLTRHQSEACYVIHGGQRQKL